MCVTIDAKGCGRVFPVKSRVLLAIGASVVVFSTIYLVVETESIKLKDLIKPDLVKQESIVVYVDELRPFEDMDTFTKWLEEDKTDQLNYSDSFTCWDFSVECARQAEKAGYRVTVVVFNDNMFPERHAFCMAQVGDVYVFWEPQRDIIQFIWTEQFLHRNMLSSSG